MATVRPMSDERQDLRRRLRTKNVTLGLVLAGIVVLFYLLGMFRFGGGS
jgi:hypothetical protein